MYEDGDQKSKSLRQGSWKHETDKLGKRAENHHMVGEEEKAEWERSGKFLRVGSTH